MLEDPPTSVRDHPGVYKWVPLTGNGSIDECIAACCADPDCGAASYNHKIACKDSEYCCGLKNAVEPVSPNQYGPSVRTIYKPGFKPPPSPSPPSPPPTTPAPTQARNVYVATLNPKPDEVTALRLPDGRRGIRARYPNADPEINGMHTIPTGWIQDTTKWSPPKQYPPPVEIAVLDPKWMRHDSTGNELGYQG